MQSVTKLVALLAFLLLALLPAPLAHAQTGTITGTITDAGSGEPLPGVNVLVEGTQQGAATGPEGSYEIAGVEPGTYTIIASFIGYGSESEQGVEVQEGATAVVDIAMQQQAAGLDEVVVVGYGSQQRTDVSGSVSSVEGSVLQDLPATSFEEALQGKVAGLQVQQPSGAPGAAPRVRIRGTGSITAGNDPLYVIDGLPISRNEELQGTLNQRSYPTPSANPLSAISSGDIASIEVLKDAASAAIYGSRGSNGVVLITTKRGNREGGAPTVSFNSYVGLQETARVPEMLNAEEFVDYTLAARNNNYLQKYSPLDPNSPNYNPEYDPTTNAGRPQTDEFARIPTQIANYDGETDTDWLDHVLDTAPTSSARLSASGGSEMVGYYLSGSYTNQEGVIGESGFQRYTLHTNVDADLSDRFQAGAHVNLSLSSQDRLPVSSPYYANPPGIVYSAMVHAPTVLPYNSDGSINQLNAQAAYDGGITPASNPLAVIEGVDEELNNHRSFGNVFLQYDVTDALSLRTSFGADLVDYDRSFYRANSLLYRTDTEGDPYAQSTSSRSLNWITENTAEYARTFGDHDVTALAGFTAQREQTDLSSVFATEFPDDAVQTISGGQVTAGDGIREEWGLLSYLARLNYSYQSRYLLTATLRADQSSRFGEGNRTGIFPSVSVGWRVSEEPFASDLDVLSDLKLRASYGETGNFLIPNYGSYSLLGRQNYSSGTQLIPAVTSLTLGDEELTWETTRQANVGVDLGLFDDRAYLNADYYYSRTSDLLLDVTLPGASGYETVLTNIGELENQGFELSLTSRNLVGDFQWTTDLNFATNTNEVLELGQSGDPILSSGLAGTRHITRIGGAVGSYYGYVVDGIYQSEEEIENAVPDELAPDPQPGDFRFEDVNSDGVVNSQDRTVIGSYQPDYTYGLSNRFEYRGVDLSVFLQGVQGREVMNLTARHLRNGEANSNDYAVSDERWRSPEDPGNGEVPRADRQTSLHGNNNRASDYQIDDGSYLRIRNVTLGYSLPSSLLGSVAQRARFWVSGKNLYTFTDYIGFNPEASNESSALVPGQDYGTYPLMRTYSVGIDLTF